MLGTLALVGCDPKAEDTAGESTGEGDVTATDSTLSTSTDETGMGDSADTATETTGEIEVEINGPTEGMLFQLAGLSASVSAEVDGYSWLMVTVPDGSGLHGETSSMSVFGLTPDAIGQYTVELVVSKGEWESEPVTHTVDVGVSDGLYVILVWDTDDTDLDLHLAADDGALFEEPLDINFCHPSADWGEPGESDDPTLNLDDLVGYGPEIISLDAPADGEYRVRVHHFTSASDGTTEATVAVFIDGELAHQESMLMAENDTWDVGVASWPELTVSAEDAVYTAPIRECY